MVRRLCPKCKKERDYTDKEKEIITSIGKKYNVEFNLEGCKTYDAVGCEYCNHIGYYDRIGIFEILSLEDEIKELIVKNTSSIEIRNVAIQHGYRPLIIDGIHKVIEGQTNLAEINKKLLIF